jgi:DNA-binding transcriptional regulator GbsR (MarR family)
MQIDTLLITFESGEALAIPAHLQSDIDSFVRVSVNKNWRGSIEEVVEINKKLEFNLIPSSYIQKAKENKKEKLENLLKIKDDLEKELKEITKLEEFLNKD